MKVAIIPARGGSKRIPRKNIRSFYGRPMIHWPIEAAQQCGLFDRIIVSTDDQEIRDIAIEGGAEVPFMRPQSLSDDHTTTNEVIIHTLEWCQQNGLDVEYACCIYATTPFLKGVFLHKAFDELIDSDSSFCFPVAVFPSMVQRALRVNPDHRLEPVWPENALKRTQDLEKFYYDAGQFYWGKADAFLRSESVHSASAAPFMLPTEYVHDIDEEDDWKLAELYFEAINKQENLL